MEKESCRQLARVTHASGCFRPLLELEMEVVLSFEKLGGAVHENPYQDATYMYMLNEPWPGKSICLNSHDTRSKAAGLRRTT